LGRVVALAPSSQRVGVLRACPGMTVLSAGIKRTTMAQPGFYFTLDAPLVSIIGLYSNCSSCITSSFA
jgi:hypothetical protein